MDPNQFDGLTRTIGSGQSRRRVLTALAGLVASAAFGRQAADAAGRLRANGVVCSKHADCESGACYPKDKKGRRVCGLNICANNQVVCTPLDECHVVGVCDPPSGICSNPNAADGTPCTRYSGVCSAGTCELFPTLSCTAGSTCESQCPDSANSNCSCGTTIEGDPVCYAGTGCAGHYCVRDLDCSDYGPTATCLYNGCTKPNQLCSSGADCAPGETCVNINDGCGGCDLYTGGKGYCTPRCTS